jgi:hypothetical protein
MVGCRHADHRGVLNADEAYQVGTATFDCSDAGTLCRRSRLSALELCS